MRTVTGSSSLIIDYLIQDYYLLIFNRIEKFGNPGSTERPIPY